MTQSGNGEKQVSEEPLKQGVEEGQRSYGEIKRSSAAVELPVQKPETGHKTSSPTLAPSTPNPRDPLNKQSTKAAHNLQDSESTQAVTSTSPTEAAEAQHKKPSGEPATPHLEVKVFRSSAHNFNGMHAINAGNGVVSASFTARFRSPENAVLEAKLRLVVGTTDKPMQYTIPPAQWKDFGVQVLRLGECIGRKGEPIYTVKFGHQRGADWKLFNALSGFSVVTLLFSFALLEAQSRAVLRETLVQACILKPQH
jgi:hypothetical protein